MSLEQQVNSDRQLVRLLQIGVVLEEVVEARASHQYQSLSGDERDDTDAAVAALLDHAAEESAEHRDRLEGLIEDLQAESVPYEAIESLVEERYGQTEPEDFDDVLYDQLHGEETAYKFYDDLIAGLEESEASFGIERERVLETLREIRAEEEEGVREVTELMEELA